MLYDLPEYQARTDRVVTLSDVTMVIAIRAHAGNPWVLERLALNGSWYDERPHLLVVDFGSAEQYRREIAKICEQQGFEYHFLDDDGVFSIAKARNAAFVRTRTEFVLFNDIDFFGPTDFFARLIRAANAVGLPSLRDQILDIPACHLGEEATRAILEAPAESRGLVLDRVSAHSDVDSFGGVAEFIAPYSNIFLCHRELFELLGGYDESFRGHGSEDFELLLRLCIITGRLPLPRLPLADLYGPTRPTFFERKGYRGFRRLFEALAFPAEREGLRVHHLFHPRARNDGTGWYAENDWGRTKFHARTSAYVEDFAVLLERDCLPRERTCLVLIRNRDHARYFLPLRLAGYRMIVCDPSRAMTDDVVRRIDSGEFDAVAIFNPYMKSHAELRPTFDRAVSRGARPIVVERGALPESWYYGPDMAYVDPDYSEDHLAAASLSPEDLGLARAYRTRLAAGADALEDQGAFDATMERLRERIGPARAVFVPLQLDDDVAVTRFDEAFQAYPSFKAELERAMRESSDVVFLVKPHPLDKRPVRLDLPNVVACNQAENVHALIELADAVVCYNSGVGLLAVLQGKRVVTVGNAFYNFGSFGRRAKNVGEAIAMARDASWGPADPAAIDRLTAWLLLRKYSFFKSRSHLRNFKNRRAHDYRDQRFYALSVEDFHTEWMLSTVSRPVGERSYLAARTGLESVPSTPMSALVDRSLYELTRTLRSAQGRVRQTRLWGAVKRQIQKVRRTSS
jgi:predicted glycosyltransferase involved in capsule biosynthesis